MSKKRGLGKGLESLLGDNAMSHPSANQQSQTVPINKLTPNPYQPRKQFDTSAIATLADSIRQHGIIQPLAARPNKDKPGYYEIIAGERRFRAAKEAGLTEVPVVIHDIDDADSAAFALIENLQREDLNVIEKAKGIQRLIKEFSLTHEACGKLLGQSRSGVSNILRLLELSSVVQEAVINHSIDMGHARALLAVDSPAQSHLLQQVRLNGLSVRETEALVKRYQGGSSESKKRYKKNHHTRLIETQLSEHLGAKVNISQNELGAGKITLAFSDNDMLTRLFEKLSNDFKG